MKRTGPKTRLARRIGEVLRDKDAKYLVKRNYPPGMHGQSRRRLSEYGTQLREKQKAKWMYLISERQFRNYVTASARHKEITGAKLLQLLELRLDNVVYRLGLANSRAAARQLVGHGFLAVNGKKVSIPSYKVSVGDQVSIREGKKQSKYVELLVPQLRQFKPQEWLSLDPKELAGKVLSAPTAEITGSTLQMDLIVEHYSR